MGGGGGGCGIIGGGVEPLVIFNSAVVILRYIFPSLVPTQAKIFSKLIIEGGGGWNNIAGVENFQQINYRGGGRLFGSREYLIEALRFEYVRTDIYSNFVNNRNFFISCFKRVYLKRYFI